MTPYVWRLWCLSLASAFAVQLCAGLAIRLCAGRIERWVERVDPSRGAALVLALRWMPGLLGLFAATCLCVPSYLRLEPEASDEGIGLLCLGLASLAVLSYLIPLIRAISSTVRSEVLLHDLLSDAEQHAGISIIRRSSPAMALAGLLRSRVVVSREAAAALNDDQMDAALRHERAHLQSGDNWKRLVLEIAPWDGGGKKLPVVWARLTEWAADDRAAGGDTARSVALASALVSVARLTVLPECPPAIRFSPLVSDRSELRSRVERLLEPQWIPADRGFPGGGAMAAACVALMASVIAGLAQQPAATALVHRILEALVG